MNPIKRTPAKNPRVRVNLMLDPANVKKARKLGINMSAAADEGLQQAINRGK